MEKKATVIHWFRKGLRIHDNPGLITAADLVNAFPHKYVLRPIFILDPEILKRTRIGPNRWRFLQESLIQLDANLRKIHSRLYVVRGNPIEVFPKLFESWRVEHLTLESDIEPYARQRDVSVEKLAKAYNVQVKQFVSHTIYDPNLIIQNNQGKAPMRYQSFLKIIADLTIPKPLGVPTTLPSNSKPTKDKQELENSKCYDCPSLAELHVDEGDLGANLYPGGETEGLRRMQMHLKNVDWICNFQKPKTSPNSLEPSTTVLSPYLKFGCVSSRAMYADLQNTFKKKKKHTSPPVSLVGQLLWREFYYAVAASEPKFDQMVGNSICRQIPWQKNSAHLKAWTLGQTGYPFIDAVMRQLRQEGWIHHLARHAVACFLTRGDLWISWEEGQKVFEELLLDADWALNAGNWMWLSTSAFFHQYHRVYSPVAFGKKSDKEGEYIRKYVPELRNYPARLIYEPWKATTPEQKDYKCEIGKEYPHRIVIHEEVLSINMSKMAEAYRKHREGSLGKFDLDNVKIKKESHSPIANSSPKATSSSSEATSSSSQATCSSSEATGSKIRKIEQTYSLKCKEEPQSPE